MRLLVPIVEGLSLLVLLALSAFFSSAETTLFSLSAVQVQRLRNRCARSGARVALLLQQPTRLLSTVLVGNTLVNVAIASLGYALINRVGMLQAYSEAVAIPVMTVLLLVLGEVAPKRVAINHAERMAPTYAAILEVWIRLLAPLRLVLESISGWMRPSLRPERKSLSDEELLTAVELGAEQGVLDEEERSMVDGILRLSEMQASDVMTPRVDMEGLDLEDPVEAQLALAHATVHRYLPVYRHTPDAIEGVLEVPRFLLDPAHDARRAITPALFVPETVALDDLLITLQRGNRHVACVLDEYGGTAGLISRGDILEIITGDIPRGQHDEGQEISRLDENRWLVDGDTSLDEINHELDLDLEADGVDRIGGWVTAQAGRFLRAGETVEAQGCRVQVRRLRKLRVEQVLLQRLPRPTADQIAAQEEQDLDGDYDYEGGGV